MASKAENRSFASDLGAVRERVEVRLEELIDALGRGPSPIGEAVRYSLLGTGKRLRPALCLWTHEALEGRNEDACLDVACAIECLHTYSLVHDDLPCMDDDDMRRGKPSCHRKYGEAVAVLAGDALLTLCFDILVSAPERRKIAAGTVLEASRIVSRAAGTGGLIGGQILDIGGATGRPSIELVEEIHTMKTAALISASMETGAVVAGASEADRARIRRAGLQAGRAFQIVDDILDVEGDQATLGKTPGKDVRDGKLTYPSLRGVEAGRAEARSLIDSSIEAFGRRPSTRHIRDLLEFMATRGS